MNKTAKINTIVLSATILSIILLIVSIIFFAANHVPKARAEEVTAAAKELVVRNFNVAYFYGIASLNAEAEYNPDEYPEGFAPCDTDIFPDTASLITYLSDTYVSEETARIVALQTPDGRPRYSSINDKLCMAIVDGDTTYDKDFTQASFYLENIKKDSADLFVLVPSKTSEQTYRLNLSMVKEGENWLLTNMVY